MRKKILTTLICATIILSPAIIAPKPVDAATNNINAKAASVQKANMIVDINYRGQNGANVNGYKTYSTVQSAVNSVSYNNNNDVVIYIKNGRYHEKITVDRPHIVFVGQDKNNTILTYNVAAGSSNGQGGTYGTTNSASLSVRGNATGFCMKNLTVANDFNENTNISSKQAVAMKNEADQSVFTNCNFLGNQDTLYAGANKQYYYNCYISGDVDFIFGGATAYFERCYINSVDRANISPKGFITAPSTPASSKYGFVFDNCTLTSNVTQKGSVYLGRPWHAGQGNQVNSSAVFLNCNMGAHISSIGWTSMSGDQPQNNRMYEYGSTGAGAIKSNTRPVLSSSQASSYNKNNVFSGWNASYQLNKLQQYNM